MNREQLIRDGYVTFNIKDFDEKLYKKLKQTISVNNSLLENRINSFKFCGELKISVLDFFTNFEKEFPNLIDNYDYKKRKRDAIYLTRLENASQNFLSTYLQGNDFQTSLKIKDFIFQNYLDKQTQSWLHGDLEWQDEIEIRNIQSKLINYFYNDNNDWGHLCFPPNKEGRLALTSFPNGSLIENHSDGKNENRLAAILIYLNEDWDLENGGNLVVRNGEKDETIIAEYGQVVILDFTENNVEHAVTEVVTDRSRWAVISFLER